MKKIVFSLTLASALFLVSCGGASKDAKKEEGSAEAGKVTEVAAPAPKTVINEADWSEVDLSTVSPMVHVSVKLPKGVKMEKNGNGGADIRINESHLFTVSTLAVSSLKEAMDSDKSLTINNKSYKNGKVISEDPNGFVYSIQMNDEANGKKYEPEAHFVYYVEKDGAFYSIQDMRPMDNYSLAGSAYPEDIAKQLYALIKGSAKAK
ncbi:MAG: hypothetical protein ACHQRM_09405 [Bacteroidia bacterium]